MNENPEDMMWQRLSKALFGGQHTTDEGLFTLRVMQEVRKRQAALEDLAWPRFLRWAVPALGVAAASLLLAARAPAPRAPTLLESVLVQQPSTDPLSSALNEY